MIDIYIIYIYIYGYKYIYIYIFAFIDIQIDRTLDWLKMDLLYFAHWDKGVVGDGEREQLLF